MRLKKTIGIFIILVITGVSFYFLHPPKKELSPSKNQILTLPVQKLQTETISIQKNYLGFVLAPEQIPITPNISGFLSHIFVKAGAEVEKNQLMFIIDQRPYWQALKQTHALTEQSLAELENTQRYYERMLGTNQEAISQANLDSALANFKSAEAKYQQAIAQEKSAEINYLYTFLRAPFKGKLNNFTLTKGTFVSPEKPIAMLIQNNPVRVQFALPFSDYHEFQNLKNQWQISLMDDKGEILLNQGHLSFSDNQINTNTNSINLYADFQNPFQKVLTGAAVWVNFQKNISGFFIPKSALTQTSNGNFIFVIHQGTIQKYPVQISSSSKEKYEITGPFTHQDLLILSPVSSDQIGQKAQGSFQ